MNEPQTPIPARSDALATTALMLGLISLFCVAGPITGIPALICGILASRRIAASGGTLSGNGIAWTGVIMGCLGSVIVSLALLAVYRKISAATGTVRGLVGQATETAWVMEVATQVRDFRREVGAWPTRQAVGAEELDAASVLAAFEARENRRKPIPKDRVKDGQLIDRWGHPLHIAVDLNDDGNVSIGTGDIEDIRVIVWSNGPDGKNDYGEGDDIRSW